MYGRKLVRNIIAGILTSVAMMPQLIKVVKENNAEDISIMMLLVLISGLSLWGWYGTERCANYFIKRFFSLGKFDFSNLLFYI